MPGPEFFQTPMGHRFFEGTAPRLVKAMEFLAEQQSQRIKVALFMGDDPADVQREIGGWQEGADVQLLSAQAQPFMKDGHICLIVTVIYREPSKISNKGEQADA